ncbi:Hypoxia up-regulated protein 1 [Chytriomyces hyalinus]|nr:Hypoxia up-regulated protein 1 [Chytriomyces hyalinus]
MQILRLLLVGLPVLQSLVAASVIGIDFGSDWFKVSIVKAGVHQVDIVLNRESKRKTDAVVTIRDGIRYFGTDAVALTTRFPESTFPFVKNLLGIQYNDPLAVEYRSIFSNNMVADPFRNTCAFSVSKDGQVYTVEEIVAMQLAHAKRQAEISGGESVSGAVITVPAYLVHHERQAILDAAEIAGIRVLQLMNDGTAVALNYIMARSMKEKETQHHIFFDMGAGSTTATLAKFTATKVKKELVPEIEILAVGYDRKLGGRTIDVKLQKHLAKIFMKSPAGSKSKEPIIGNARSMARLLKEANRVKQILSANTETIASVEGLHEEIDFKYKISRAELEGLCGNYFQKVLEPIKSVLKQSDLSMKKLDSLVLVGGAVRIPAVQSALRELIGEEKIAANVNQDEANVLGAGFRAAGISKQFKVNREIRIKDAALAPIEVIYNLEAGEDQTKGRETHTTLFHTNSSVPSKKLMNFKRVSDFSFSLAYKNAKTPILSAKVSGLGAAITKHRDSVTEAPKVKAQIELSESMMVNVEHITAHFEVAQTGKDGGSIKDWLFGSKKDKAADGKGGNDDTEDVKEEVDHKKKPKTTSTSAKKEKKDDATDGKSSDASATASPTPEPDTKKVTTEKVKLTFDIEYNTLSPLTDEVKSAAKKRFAVMDEEDAARRAREEAMNNLEAFIYSSQDFLESETLLLVSTESQRETFSVQVAESQAWLDDFAFEAATKELGDKLKDLKSACASMYSRVQELGRRPIAVAAYRELVSKANELLTGLQVNVTIEDNAYFGLYNATEFDTGFAKLEEYSAWLTDKEAEQAKVAPHDTPAYRAREVDLKREELMQYLSKNFMRVPKKVPVKLKTTSVKVPKPETATDGTGAQTSAETPDASEEETKGKDHKGGEEPKEDKKPSSEEAGSREEL